LEPIECQALFDWASRIDTSTGITRSQSVCDFAGECFSNVKPHIKKLMQTLNEKKRKSNATPSPAGVLFQQIVNEGTLAPVLPALEAIRKMEKVNLYRGELYHEMCRSLKEHLSNPTVTLKECALVVRERTRRLGRHFPNKTVGTTLLIKGMEFDHCMVMDAHSHDKNNLYVALTRGSRTLTIVSKEPELKPTS
jgi:DNA helicase-2/ATP-dependent DNA helicase PcrA